MSEKWEGCVVFWGDADDRRVEQRLRALLAENRTIEEAVRVVHLEVRIGALLLCRPLERITGLSALEVKRLVVRALFPMRWG